MTALSVTTSPTELNLLVAFTDLTNFGACTRTLSPPELYAFVSDYYEYVGDVIEHSGGTVIKFMGDAILAAWPEPAVAAGVLALKELHDAGDAWLRARGINGRHVIKAHFGPVWCGQLGTRREKRLDLFGETVNTAALLPSHGLALSPQVFRQLPAVTRRQFKKHTPPVTYIPVEERHQ